MNKYAIEPNTEKVINGITFTHEYDADNDPKSDIYVEKGNYSASLTCASDCGEWSGRGDPVQIPPKDLETIEKVYDWWENSDY